MSSKITLEGAEMGGECEILCPHGTGSELGA